MTTTGTSTAIVVAAAAFSDPERLALAGFLAGYRGLTRDADTLDLPQFAAWCERCMVRAPPASPFRGPPSRHRVGGRQDEPFWHV